MAGPQTSTLFRSKEMQYVSITMSIDAAHDTVRELGNFGKFHVVDLNNRDQPSKQVIYYKKRVADCAVWERKLESMIGEMKKYDVFLPDAFPPEEAAQYREEKQGGDVLATLKNYFDPIESDLRRSVAFQEENERLVSQLIERGHVLRKMKDHVVGGALQRDFNELSGADASRSHREVELNESKSGNFARPLLGGHDDIEAQNAAHSSSASKFKSELCGVIDTDKQVLFARMLHRISRGNAFVRFFDIEEHIPLASGGDVLKTVFSIIVVGQQLESRIKKVVQLFQGTLYQLPTQPQQFDAQLETIAREIKEKRDVAIRTLREIEKCLEGLSGGRNRDVVSPLRHWQHVLKCEKAICDTMMKCHFYLTMIAMEGWCPVEEYDGLQLALDNAVKGTGTPVAAIEVNPARPIKPPGAEPTYFALNRFTSIFQGIVDTYGVPRYQEVNPGLFTIITFPFLFGVMYGDMGHGTMLTLASLCLVAMEKKLQAQADRGELNEILRMAFEGRYLLVCMGFMAIYMGTIYNDCMSIPVSLYNTRWSFPEPMPNTTEVQLLVGVPGSDQVYPYGVDPSWYNTKNQLLFFNSMKMKSSIVLGVFQMTFGIILGLFNHVHTGDRVGIFLEFLPQLLFMLCTFGYMVALIILKACVDWGMQPDRTRPNLIQVMITMFLSPGKVDPDGQLYDAQGHFQLALVIIAVVCIPIMLCGRPCVNKRRHAAEHAVSHVVIARDDDVDGEPEHKDGAGHEAPSHGAAPAKAAGGGHGHGDGPYSFADDMIHQGIHTIEFVLGAVSNTASYLRLWALSLAHSELAEVFWEKMIDQYGINAGSPIMIFVAFAVWFALTVGVLLMMDVLECFLHALRLHWVEFQNKFYHADGYAFKPFNFLQVNESD